MKWIRWISVVLMLVLVTASAAQVPNLNSAMIAVENRSAHSLQVALPSALTQVLIKVSGNANVASLPDLQNALKSPQQYLQSYSYAKQIKNNQPQLYLQTQFDVKAIRQLLRQAKQPTWQANRPLVLVWLKIAGDSNPYILSNDNNQLLVDQVKQIAAARGLPIVIPMMDLQDQSQAQLGNVMFNPSHLQSIAARYQAPIILAGYLTQGINNQWQSQWLLLSNNAPLQWQSIADNMIASVNAGVNKLGDVLASQLAVTANVNSQQPVQVIISDVNNLTDYVRVTSRLKRLSIVAAVRLKSLQADQLTLQLKVVGGMQALENTLQHQRHFAAIANSGVALIYRWQR